MLSRAWPTIVGLIVMTVVLIFLHHEFAALVAPAIFYPWLGFMAASLGGIAIAMAVFAVPRWRDARPGRFWVAITRLATVAICGGIAASVWILMPVANSDQRSMMIFLYMWFVAMVMMADGELLGALGSIALIASLASFVLLNGMPYAVPLAGFLVLAGVAILAIRRFIWRAANDAADARAMAERANEALNQALALVTAERDAKTRFLASASHDLQQPLQAATLYFDQVVGRSTPAPSERAIAGVRSALSSTQALLGSMLDYLRLEAGATAARLDRVALDPVVAAVLLEHGAGARAAGMRLIAVHRDLTVVADPQLLKRVLGNLVANAVRHAQGERILIGARRHGDLVRLWVIDDGNGVAAGDAPRLFDDYAQGSDHGPGGRGGFGLGLASARRMTHLMHGAIGLDLRWTSGAAFHVDLRAAAARPQTAEADSQCKAA